MKRQKHVLYIIEINIRGKKFVQTCEFFSEKFKLGQMTLVNPTSTASCLLLTGETGMNSYYSRVHVFWPHKTILLIENYVVLISRRPKCQRNRAHN